MDDNKEYIDFVIRESLTEKEIDSFPPELAEKIIRKISRDKLFRTIFFDFSIKSISVLIIIAISVAVFLTIGNKADFWLSFLKNNISILIGSLGVLYFIFFLNEITEKYLLE